MKLSLTLAASLLLFSTSSFAQKKALTQTPQEAKNEKLLKILGTTPEELTAIFNNKQKISQKFNDLPEETREKFKKAFLKSTSLSKKKRISEALYHALEADKIFHDHLALMGQLGSLYVELRVFKEARASYAEALEIDPFNPGILFNAAEVEFVDKQYKKALKRFKTLQKMMTISPSIRGLEGIISFKIELCHLALSKDKSLSGQQRKIHRQFFDKAVGSRDFRTHKLITYYGKAVKCYDAGEDQEAQLWIKKSRIVFPDQIQHLAFLDTILEFGFINKLFKDKQLESPKDNTPQPTELPSSK